MRKYLDWIFVIWLFLCLVGLMVFTSCRGIKQTEAVTDIQQSTDTIRIYQQRTDSIYCRDSIYLREYMCGDTVYSVKYKDRIEWRVRNIIDTIYLSKSDTIVKTEYTEKATEDKTTFWDRCRSVLTIIEMAFVIFLFILFVIKLRGKFFS